MMIAPVVHGRFYPFDIARSLTKRGHVAQVFASGPFDVIHVFSGVTEELLGVKNGALRLLVRGFAHIRTQDRILAEESVRVNGVLSCKAETMPAAEMGNRQVVAE